MSHPGPPLPPSSEDEGPFDQILLICLKQILRYQHPHRFLRWAQDQILPLLHREEPDLGPGEGRRLCFLLARAIWNVTPLPGSGFRPQPLHAPNDAMPCPCGSTLPYGKCCGAILDAPEIPPDLVWELLLTELDEPLFDKALRSGQVPSQLLGFAAERWLAMDRPGRAIALLEPLFKENGPDQMDGRYEHALNILCDAYDRRDHWKKKRALLNRMRLHPSQGLRAAAWQRLCTIHIDEGSFTEAQLAFSQVQREAPDDPGTALLEIALLATQHEEDLARSRALFWRHKLRRAGNLDTLILDFLEQASRDPQDALMSSQAAIIDPRLMDLRDWVRAVGDRPLPHYHLAPTPDPDPTSTPTPDAARASAWTSIEDQALRVGTAWAELAAPAFRPRPKATAQPQPPPAPAWRMQLCPPSRLRALETHWHQIFPAAKPPGHQLIPGPESPDPWASVEAVAKAPRGWLGFLDRHPEAADSLDILDDLITAVYGHPDSALTWVRYTLLWPLVERARLILELAAPADSPHTLPWDLALNRPGLRLLFHRYLTQVEAGQDAAAFNSLRTLLRLNPWDQHGLRADLMNHYLRSGEDEAALTLAQAYPDDWLVELVYGEVLALYRRGAAQQARQALGRALRRLPLIPRYLTQKRIARPQPQVPTPHPASDETAWFYRESMRDVWSAVPGLLDWLKRQQAG